MPVETDDDRLVFVDPDDFGVEAIYVTAAAVSATLNVLFNRPSIDFALGEAGAVDRDPWLTCRSSDVPSGALGGDVGDTVTVASETWRVVAIKPDGSGMTRIDLGK